MINVLVTVGTTPFDELIRAVDQSIAPFYNVRFQISKEGKYIPQNGFSLPIYEKFDQEIKNADIVICHAGAGTVFPLLEMSKKMVVVPNIFRRDLHQKELAHFLQVNRFCSVVWDLSQIKNSFELSLNTVFYPYNKYSFCLAEELTAMIFESLSFRKTDKPNLQSYCQRGSGKK